MHSEHTEPAAGPAAKTAAGLGILAALVASLCCVGPAVLALLGLGGAATVLSLTRFHTEFMVAAGLLLAAAVVITVRRSRRTDDGAACCVIGPSRKTKTWQSALLLLAVFAAAYGLINFVLLPAWYARAADPVAHSTAPADPASLREVVLAIDGMTCEVCTTHIRSEVAKVPGVHGVDVRYKDKQAVVSYDPSRASIQSVQKAVEAAGYRAAPQAESPDHRSR